MFRNRWVRQNTIHDPLYNPEVPRERIQFVSVPKKHDRQIEIGEKLATLVRGHESLDAWLPHVSKHYANPYKGAERLRRARSRRDLAVFTVHQCFGDSSLAEPGTESIIGLASMHTGQSLFTNRGETVNGSWTALSYWLAESATSEEHLLTAGLMASTLPQALLRPGMAERVFAPVQMGVDPLDPSYGFSITPLMRHVPEIRQYLSPEGRADGFMHDDHTAIFVQSKSSVSAEESR